MSNRIPTHAQTWYADSPHRDQNDMRVARNQRRNARKRRVTTIARPDVPWRVCLMNENRRKVRRAQGLA